MKFAKLLNSVISKRIRHGLIWWLTTKRQRNPQEYSGSTLNDLNQGTIPQYLRKGRLILISKSSKPFPSLDDTRPLLQLNLTKIIEKTIYNKLTGSKSKLLEIGNYKQDLVKGFPPEKTFLES